MSKRTDLNGMRFRLPRQAEVYLIDEGQRRWIPDPSTYDNLFRDWEGINKELYSGEIDEGPHISSGAFLARAMYKVYLVTNQQKRWITTEETMDRYYFDWQKISQVPQRVLDELEDGSDIV